MFLMNLELHRNLQRLTSKVLIVPPNCATVVAAVALLNSELMEKFEI